MIFKTKLDPSNVPYLSFSLCREKVAIGDRTAGATGSVDRMLQGATVYNQIGESCTGESMAQQGSALSQVAGARKQYSALAAYYFGRIEEYLFLHPRPEDRRGFNPDGLSDDGTFPWASTQAWKVSGLPLEADWPHDEAILNKPPAWGACTEGDAHRTSEVYRIDSSDSQLLLDMTASVRADHPVGITIVADSDLLQHTGTDSIGPRDLSRKLGLHRLPILGITGDGLFIALNSWGWEWGDNGLCYLTPELLTTQVADVTVLTGMPL